MDNDYASNPHLDKPDAGLDDLIVFPSFEQPSSMPNAVPHHDQTDSPTLFRSPPHFAVDISDGESPSEQPLHSPPPLPIPPPTRSRPGAQAQSPQPIATSPVSSPRMGDLSSLPLQVQAQLLAQQDQVRRKEQPSIQPANAVGHTRSFEIPREPTLIESLSRTVRNIVPIPATVGSALLSGPPTSPSPHFPHHFPHQHGQGAQGSEHSRGIDPGLSAETKSHDAGGMTYPFLPGTGGAKDPIIWSKWDTLGPSRIIIIAYASGMQIWDCSNLRGVVELLNLKFVGPEWSFSDCKDETADADPEESTIRRVAHAGILPAPSRQSRRLSKHTADDPFENDRPLLGFLMTQRSQKGSDSSHFVIYSLHRHTIVKRIKLSGIGSHFEANDRFLVISTINPPTICVFSTSTLQTLFTIPSTSLVPFAHKSSVNKLIPPAEYLQDVSTNSPDYRQGHHQIINNKDNQIYAVSIPNEGRYNYSGTANTSTPDTHLHTNPVQILLEPEPVFALSRRLLAFASVPPHQVTPSAHHPRTNSNAHLQATPHAGISVPSTGVERSESPSRSRSRASSQSQSISASSSPPSVTGITPSQPPVLRGTPPAVQHIHHYQQQRIPSPSTSLPLFSDPRGTPGPSHYHRRSLGGVGISNPSGAELVSNAALKVGGSVLSGMKVLGGLALTAAAETTKNVVNNAINVGGGNPAGTSSNRFFSRSAPSPSAGVYGLNGADGGATEKERRFSSTDEANGQDLGMLRKGWVSGLGAVHHQEGYYITVLDLSPLLHHSGYIQPTGKGNQAKESTPEKKRKHPQPAVVAEFRASKSQRVSKLKFSTDGNSIAVATEDGHSISIYAIKPLPTALRPAYSNRTDESEAEGKAGAIVSMGIVGAARSGNGNSPPWHVYDLRRGRTSAVVESIEWDGEGKWIAVGTRKGTVHVFAINPYGGKADIRSHIQGKVQNVGELQPLSTAIMPLVRLRSTAAMPIDRPKVPLECIFITPSEIALSSNLLPSPTLLPSTSPSSLILDSASPPSPHLHHHQQRPTNYQDVLLFDPIDGILSLRRFTLEARTVNERSRISGVATSVSNFAGTSISLPKFGSVGSSGSSLSGRLSVSPNTGSGIVGGNGARGRLAGTSGTKNAGADTQNLELVAKESIVARWDLQRRGDWEEVKRKLGSGTTKGEKAKEDDQQKVLVGAHRPSGSPSDWLAQAELSTHSRSARVYPRTIYLSHQYSFHTLGEDYHALIRRYKLDIGGAKITVRRAVEISAFGTTPGRGDGFIEGFNSPLPRDVREIGASSFDEPLATAIAGAIDYKPPQTTIPMLPNGTPGGSKSFRNAIPIRSAVDGVGRLGREVMHKVRSPPLLPRTSDAPQQRAQGVAPSGPIDALEFNEEDEEFLYTDLEETGSRGTALVSRGGNIPGASGSTDATGVLALDMEDEVQLMSASIGGVANIEVIEPEDNWHGWDVQDKLAVEEAERFDDISVVGFLDEEQESQKQAAQQRRRRK